MNRTYDCIVAGLGAAGSAALFHLARRGARVAGFDAHTPPHTHGSSHGETRMIREAYFENACYVPLVRRAYDLWHELAASSGMPLIEETGGVFAGRADGEMLPGIRVAAREYGIAVKELSRDGRSREFPWLRPADDMDALTEPRAGFLNPERCIQAHLDAAAGAGAELHAHEAVQAWSAADGVVVETVRGRYHARRLILATGAWMTGHLAQAGVTAAVARQPLFWFSSIDDAVARALPVWAVEFETGRLLYGFPDRGRGLKVAIHDGGTPATPDTIERRVLPREIDHVRSLTERFLPGLFGELLETATCMYTLTPDGHFVIDTHPAHADVLLVSACSGHGFKFSSAVGECAAQWTLDGAPALDLSPFSLARFRSA